MLILLEEKSFLKTGKKRQKNKRTIDRRNKSNQTNNKKEAHTHTTNYSNKSIQNKKESFACTKAQQSKGLFPFLLQTIIIIKLYGTDVQIQI